MASRSVEVKIELGHRATLRDEPTVDGYTHDWQVFVRGPDGCKIENFVEKVVFQLHESFPKAKRTYHKPPFEVAESGYAGFNMPIWVYFKTKEEPKKIEFIYDLYLSLDGKPINNIRCEKLTFHNPPDDFCQKLLKGGGTFQNTSPPKKPATPPEKKASPETPSVSSNGAMPKPFQDWFGAPIIKGQDPKDFKREKRKDKKDKEYKKEKKEKDKIIVKEEKKDAKLIEKSKPNGKVEPVVPITEIKKEPVREKKRETSSSPPQKEDIKDLKKKKKKSSHKDSPDPKRARVDDSLKAKKKSQSKESLVASPLPNVPAIDDVDLSFTPSPPEPRKSKSKDSKTKSLSPMDDMKDARSLPPPKTQAPKRVASPAELQKKKKQIQQNNKNNNNNSNNNNDNNNNSSILSTIMMEMESEPMSSPEFDLVDLQKLGNLKYKILSLTNEKLQMVVDIVEKTGKFEISDESFDFDLRQIDNLTISRIQHLIS